VREDCAQRLEEVDKAMPSVVFEVKDGASNDVPGVSVSIDGQPLADRLDGSAIAIDPGDHTFLFEAEGIGRTQKKLVLHEAEKDRYERIILGAPSSRGSAPIAPAEAEPENAGTPALAYVAFGVAGVALVSGVVFTVLAIDAKSGACDQGCTGPQAQAANDVVTNRSIAAGIGYGVAVAAATVGLVVYLKASRTPRTAASVGLAPRVGLGWLGFEGSFQ
jgi:hypothetical protein